MSDWRPDWWTDELERKMQDRQAWERRLQDLETVLEPVEWERLRLDLRREAKPHAKTDPLYRLAADCPHEVNEDDLDELHVWGGIDGEYLICLSEVTGHACFCEDGYCGHLSAVEAAREELWLQVDGVLR